MERTKSTDRDSKRLTAGFKWAVFLLPISTGIYFTMPYTIVVYMVADFGIASGEDAVGRLTGYVASMSHVGALLAAMPWSAASNRVGRKPVIVTGHLLSGLTVLCFGLSPNYPFALMTRFVGGLMNGVSGALKTLIGESSSAEEAPRSMSLLGTGWGVGCVLGPMLGGALSKPCARGSGVLPFSSALCKEGAGVLARHPYLLPCAVCLLFNVAASIMALVCFEETRTPLRARGGCCFPRPSSSAPAYHSMHQDASDEGDESLRTTSLEQLPRKEPGRSWWRCAECVTHLAMYGIIAFFCTFLDEMFPIFAAAARDAGGLHLSARQLSLPLGVSGACLLTVTLLFYPMVVRRLGLKRSLVAGCLMMIVPTFLIPLVAYVPSHQLSTQLVLLAMCLGVKSAAQGVGFTSVLVLLNQSAPNGEMATVNGVAQTISACVRALGPALGGILWGLSIYSGLPGRQIFVFAFANVCCSVAMVVYSARQWCSNEFCTRNDPTRQGLSSVDGDGDSAWTELVVVQEESQAASDRSCERVAQ